MPRYFEDVEVGESHDLGAYTADREETILDDTAAIGSFGLDELRWTAPVRPGDTVCATLDVGETRASDSHDDRGQ
jgi:acyl dehydratase